MKRHSRPTAAVSFNKTLFERFPSTASPDYNQQSWNHSKRILYVGHTNLLDLYTAESNSTTHQWCPVEKIPFIYNAIEIGIWAAFAIGFMIAAVKRDGSTRIRCVFASLLFLFFGASDAVELYTGASWKPWWLLVWKALCVISLIALYFDNVTSRVQLSKQAASASDASDDGQQ